MSDQSSKSKKILITSALPYVNNIPHLGNLICILSADVYARFERLNGNEVLSVVGTDEHGTTSEIKALEEGKTPQEVCDEYFAKHKEIYEWFSTSFNCIGRSSTATNAQVTQEIYGQLKENGFILEKTTTQYYDPLKKTFLADRFVKGTCPHCGFTDARGDQCDSCGKLLEPSQLKDAKSSISDAKPEQKETTHLYIDLPKIQKELAGWIGSRKSSWSKNAQGITQAWLDKGLEPRAITRDLSWGIAVPDVPNKVFYSWFDAPIAYIGITKHCLPDSWESWWKNDDKVELVQFMGKDNTQFHTILFPSFLLGTKQPYTFLNKLSVNEYLTYEGGKFSKSRNVGVFGNDAMESGLHPDAFRYYIMAVRPEGEDADFSWEDFANRLNKEFIGNFANLVNRTISFTNKFTDGEIAVDAQPIDGVTELFDKVKADYQLMNLKDALKGCMQLAKRGNQYFQENEPWKLIKEDPEKTKVVLANLVSFVKDLTIALTPITPKLCDDVFVQLNVKNQMWSDIGTSLPIGHKLNTEKPLLEKFSADKVAELKEKCGDVKEGEEFPLDLRVGKIIEIEQHPDAEKLYVEKIDLGDGEIRQIVSGLKEYYEAEELLGKKVIVVANLKAAKLRGVKSEGMILAGEDSEKRVKVLEAKTSKPGDSACFEGYFPNEKRITFEDFVKVKLKIQDGNVLFEKKKLQTKIENIKVGLGNGIVS